MMPLTPDDYARIDALCPELQKILDDELAAGNRVATTFEGWGTIVMLEQHFRVQHEIGGGRVTYLDVDDPHYWKSQYSVKELEQHVACKF
jgi:hypothetical protein